MLGLPVLALLSPTSRVERSFLILSLAVSVRIRECQIPLVHERLPVVRIILNIGIIDIDGKGPFSEKTQ